MVAKLTVILFIFLCLMVGIFLTLLPWVNIGGFVDWGDNYLLVVAAQKSGLPVIQRAVGSGWFRGAVSGLGILNIILAFWEMAHFQEAVRMLDADETPRAPKTVELGEK